MLKKPFVFVIYNNTIITIRMNMYIDKCMFYPYYCSCCDCMP